jgi:SAM-dependent methyltransferase
MSEEEDVAKRILKFYQECLRGNPPVASLELIQDSQTSRLLAEIFREHAAPSIIDYGCGSLRLLHALLTKADQRDWTYSGLDVSDPAVGFPDSYNRLTGLPHRDRWRLQSISSARVEGQKYDIGIIMNVFHELSIMETAYAFQDMRRLLNENGTLLIVDTVFLHEGEPRFVPWYPWEIQAFTSVAEDKSYRSKSGIPIAFYRIPRDGLPSFFNLPKMIEHVMRAKRDYWAQLAVDLSIQDGLKARKALGLGRSKEFDYGYLNTIIANASFRISEFSRNQTPAADELNSCAHDLVRAVQETFHRSRRCPSADDLFVAFGTQYEYSTIEQVLISLQGHGFLSRGVIFPISDPLAPLTPSDAWEVLEDRIGIEKIKTLGIERCVNSAVDEADFP